jgi:hypothetical protein
MGGGSETSGGSTGQTTSSSKGYSRPLSERAHPAQWALYGPTAAMLMEKAFGGTRDRQIMETSLRDKAFANSVGGAQRWGNSMASQGVDPSSPVNAAVNRGLQSGLVGNLVGASNSAEQAQRATQNDYAKLISQFIGNWPPAESWSTSQSQSTQTAAPSSGGGGGK